jgi:hypothetical protein
MRPTRVGVGILGGPALGIAIPRRPPINPLYMIQIDVLLYCHDRRNNEK